MSPKKLNDDDKTEILKLYRETSATTSTLADHYGVSSSTISRFLKTNLSETEYEDLIQQKRLARTSKVEDNEDYSSKQTSLELYLTQTLAESFPLKEEPTANIESKTEEKKTEDQHEPQKLLKNFIEEPKKTILPVFPKKAEPILNNSSLDEEEDDEDESVQIAALGEMFGEDLLDLDEEDDLEEDWDEEDDLEADYPASLTTEASLQILPLADAQFPPTCYIVIDRTAELITCPLREFTHLGNIPDNEVYQRTLPIFDNHRVARRFSKRSQRVIKVPDARIFRKTSSYLAAKGITRIFLDGRIYALSSV